MFPILFILLCVVVLAFVMNPVDQYQPQNYERARELPPHAKAFEILDQRFAKGEIGRAEYEEKRRTIAQVR